MRGAGLWVAAGGGVGLHGVSAGVAFFFRGSRIRSLVAARLKPQTILAGLV